MPKEKYQANFKVRTVLEGLKSPDGISAYCRRQGISEAQFYQWQKQILENADALFTRQPKNADKKITQLEEELKRKDRIIAVVTEEALELKKTYEIAAYKRLSLEAKLDLLDMLERYTHYGWTKKQICRKWGISVQRLYALKKESPQENDTARRTCLNAITPAEREVVRSYALSHTELNHREMAYRMIDEDVAFMSPSSVYRILKEFNLLSVRGERDRTGDWNAHQKLTGPDQVWQTDLMTVRHHGRDF